MSKPDFWTLLFAVLCVIGPAMQTEAASPNMVRLHTWKGDKYYGPLVEESEDEVSIFDISSATTVRIEKKAIKTKLDKIDETQSDSYVPFASYAAWKLGKILHTGRLEATIVHHSEKGVFVNLGSEDGIETGRRCVLLGDPETIIDPTTNEVLGVIREQLGNGIPLAVVSDKLSKLNLPKPVDDEAKKLIGTYAVKRQVEIDQKPKRIVLAPPRWKPTADADSLADDANFLHAHLIAELVRYGFTVVSKKQTEKMRQSIVDDRKIDVLEVPDIEIAKNAKADVLVSVDMQAKGITCQVQLQVTELKSDEYLGIISGSTRRKDQKKEAERAETFARGILAGKRLGVRPNPALARLFTFAKNVNYHPNGKVSQFFWDTYPVPDPMNEQMFAQLCKLESLHSLTIGGKTFLSDQAVSRLTTLKQLKHLRLYKGQVSDQGCKIIASSFPRLKECEIGFFPRITDVGIKHLATIKGLEDVKLDRMNVGDGAVGALSTLPNLRRIEIISCKLSDRGLAELQKCKQLKEVNVRNTNVTRNGVAKLKAALPDCRVLSDF